MDTMKTISYVHLNIIKYISYTPSLHVDNYYNDIDTYRLVLSESIMFLKLSDKSKFIPNMIVIQ